MASFSLKMLGAKQMVADMARIERSTDRATMWALRQGGRKIQSYAKAAAPVYTGKPRTSQGQPVLKGELKKSIKSSKRLKSAGPGSYSLKVGPRGRPHLYAARQEARHPFMGPAVARVSGEFRGYAEQAWTRAIKWNK
jgi:hypothetical protein